MTIQNIIPTFGYLLIKPLPEEDTNSKIESIEDNLDSTRGEILAIAKHGKLLQNPPQGMIYAPMEFRPTSIVHFLSNSGEIITIGGKEYLLVDQEDVIAEEEG